MAPSLPPLASSLSSSDLSSGDQPQYNFNSKVMVAAMLLLCIVVLFVVSLHVYAKWFWRQGHHGALLPQSNARDALWRRRWRIPVEPLVPTISVGLDSATVSSLPTFIYQTSKHPDGIREPLLECAVCLSEFQAYEKGRLLPNCKHCFHIGCIDMWFLSHSTCPLCREPVSPWLTPQHHAENALAQAKYSPSFAQSLPTGPYLQNDQLTFHLSLQNLSSPVTNIQGALQPCTAVTPPLPLQCNSRLYVQAEHQEGFAKINNALDTEREFHASCLQSDCSRTCSSSPSLITGSTIEIQLGEAESGAAIARCQSLGVQPRCSQAEDSEACWAQPAAIKSSSFRMSIKRLLSRDVSRAKGRIFPSAAGDAGAEQDRAVGQSSLRSSLPLRQEEEGEEEEG